MKLFLILVMSVVVMGFIPDVLADEDTSVSIPIKMEPAKFTQNENADEVLDEPINPIDNSVPFKDSAPAPKKTALDLKQILQQNSKLLDSLIGDGNTDTE
jgi:hypothetical protein